MFLKKHSVRRQGTTYSYYRIVEAYRDSQGKSRHRTVKYLGVLPEEEATRIRAGLREGTATFLKEPSSSATEDRAPLSRAYVLDRVSELVYPAGAPEEWNVTDTHILLLVQEGRGRLKADDAIYRLRKGAALYFPPGKGMHVGNPYDGRLTLLRITFSILAVGGSAPELGTESEAYVPRAEAEWDVGEAFVRGPARIVALGEELRSNAMTAPRANSLRSQLVLHQLLDTLYGGGGEAEAEEGAWLQAAIRNIHERYSEQLTRDQAAARIGVSAEHFSRVFRRETGHSFVDYVNRIRIRKAQELLQLTRGTLAEIAKRSGFGSEYYFSRKFKQIMGSSPTAYRQMPKTYASLSPHLTSWLVALGAAPRYGVIEEWMREPLHDGLTAAGFVSLPEDKEEALRFVSAKAPDLVLASDQEPSLEQLRERAPVCTVADVDENWIVPFLKLAHELGKQQEAERWLKRFEDKIARTREQVAPLLERGSTVTILKIVSDQLYLYGQSTSMGGYVLYEALGLKPPAAVRREVIDRRLSNRAIRPDELPLYAGDHLFLFDYRSKWYPQHREWMDSQEWRGLEAVRSGRVHQPTREFFYGYDCLSLELQLEEVASCLSSYSD